MNKTNVIDWKIGFRKMLQKCYRNKNVAHKKGKGKVFLKMSVEKRLGYF